MSAELQQARNRRVLQHQTRDCQLGRCHLRGMLDSGGWPGKARQGSLCREQLRGGRRSNADAGKQRPADWHHERQSRRQTGQQRAAGRRGQLRTPPGWRAGRGYPSLPGVMQGAGGGRQGGRLCRKARRQAPQPHVRSCARGAISRESALAWQERAGALAGDWQDVRLDGRRDRRRQGVANGLRNNGVCLSMLNCVAGADGDMAEREGVDGAGNVAEGGVPERDDWFVRSGAGTGLAGAVGVAGTRLWKAG